MGAGRVTSVNLLVSDLAAAGRFYGDFLGYQLDEPHQHEGNEAMHYDLAWGNFESGEFMMLHITQAAPGQNTTRAEIGCSVDDLDALVARAAEFGVPVVQPVMQEPWGRNVKLADPDGNIISATEG